MSSRNKALRSAVPLAALALLTFVALAGEGGNVLDVRSDASLGDIIADTEGNTLYLFLPDAQGDSTCYDTCAQNWPPLAASDDLTVAEGLDASLLGTVTRTDDSEQVTYGGWPLYTFAGDTEPGQTNGQGLNDVWFAVAADGTAAGAPEAPAGGSEETEDAAESEGEQAEGDETDDIAAGLSDDEVAALMSEGATVFSRICSTCHGANGDESLVEHAAILADNSKLENERRVLRRVIHGGGYMPQFGNVLSDREVAAVVTYIRNSWGNDYGPVGEEAAAEAR